MQTNSVLIKVCGITNIEDAKFAVEFGADIIGVILDKKIVRHGDESLIKEIKGYNVPVAGVYTNFQSIGKNRMNEDIVQLHFDHSPDHISYIKENFGKKVISVVKYTNTADAVAKCKEYREAGADYVLVERRGGIEDVYDDILLLSNEVKIAVAGKISDKNVQKFLKPNIEMIDLSSSIEEYPGKKDIEKMKKLFNKVRGRVVNIQ